MPRRKKPVEQSPEGFATEDFVVKNTSAENQKQSEMPERAIDDIIQSALERAARDYNFDNKKSSIILDNSGSVLDPTTDYLNSIALYPQDNLEHTKSIIRIISKQVNLDDVLGQTVESIRVNVNPENRLSYKAKDGRNKGKKLNDAKELIDDFNDEIKLKRIIREKVPDAYQDGTVIMYLRKDSGMNWVVDYYPIGLAEISSYTIGGLPVVMINMTELKSRIQNSRSQYKDRAGKSLFYQTLDEEIMECFPDEVYQAYLKKDPYAKLNPVYTGVVRVGNRGKKYGLSPLFRALPSSILLQTFRKSDEVNAKARSKKILWQSFKDDVAKIDPDRNFTKEMAFAHKELRAAYSQTGSVLYSAPSYIGKLEYVNPQSDLIDEKTISHYLSREMSTLGIGFLFSSGSNQSVSAANISLEQLMKSINSISEQFEEIFKRWYEVVLQDKGFDPSYAPNIKILDSEALDFELRKEWATTLYTIFNLSMRTSLEVMGIDLDDEKAKRKAENDEKLEELFFVRSTAYTSSGSGKVDPPNNGRPKGEENDKQNYDQNYNQDARPDK